MSRILTALLLIPPFLAVLLLAPAWSFLLLAEIVALAAVHELFDLARECGHRPLRAAGYLSTALLAASFHAGRPPVLWTSLVVLFAVAVGAVARGEPRRETLGEVSITVMGALYVGLLTGCVLGLRMTPPDTAGRYWVLFLLLVVYLGDTGAYYGGRAFGRRPLATGISPNKTVEGLLGGLASSVVAAVVAGPLLFTDLNRSHAAGLGLVLALAGALGDLFESALKRSAGVKDTSTLLPGHGGVLDRLDSVFFSAPALLVYVRTIY